MVQLPIGFFMPLPLPIMIPFMMWQSAAIAAGFGTYFQYAKRRVSAMSNEEFNKSNPHDLVNDMYDELIVAMPSSFKKIESLTPIILDSMLKMLTDAANWFSSVLGGGGLPDIAHHLAGLPGHVGHSVLGEDGETGSGGGTGGENVHEPIHVNNVPSQTINWLTKAIAKIRNSEHGHPHYDVITTANIEKEFAARKLLPPEDEPGVKVPTSPVPTGFLSTLTKENYPLINKLVLKALQNIGSYAAAIALAGRHWQNAAAHEKQDASAISRENNRKLKLEWGRLIVAMNKAVSKGLPYTL